MIQQITDNDEAWDSDLSGRKRNFIIFYCTDDECFMNGRKAYIKAYTKYKQGKIIYTPSDEVADAAASRLLRDVKVKQSCRTLLQMLQPDVDTDNASKLLHDLFIQATFNPADIIDENGQLQDDLETLGDKAKCISQIQQSKYGTKVILCDRTKAQDTLMEYYDLIRQMPEHDVSLPVVEITQKSNDVEEWNAINDSNKEE